MARRQGAKTGRNVADAALRDGHIFKIACSFIDSTKPVRLKSLIKKYKVNDACTLRDSSLGLTLLQIAIIADNIPAGDLLFFPSFINVTPAACTEGRLASTLSADRRGQASSACSLLYEHLGVRLILVAGALNALSTCIAMQRRS